MDDLNPNKQLKQRVLDDLLNFVAENFMVDAEDINLDKSLIDEGVIDSFGLIEISSFLEEEFEIEIDEDDMNRDNFGSVNRIVDFVCNRGR